MSLHTRRSGLLVVLFVTLAVVLTTMAGPASASTTVNTLTWVMMGELDPGDELPPGDDGTWYGENWVAYSLIYRATGPDGWRFLGYGAVCLDTVIPPKGDNHHSGEIVWFAGEDPSTFWNPNASFESNLVGHDLLWTGTWDGRTLNKRLHKADVQLSGRPGSDNEGCTVVMRVQSGNFDVANWHSGNYVGTPWNSLAYVTAP
jgi:hypothetical protein